MKTKRQKKKNKIISLVCTYVMKTKMISGRAIAKKLGIHFTTWHRYVRGERSPNSIIKAKLAAMMGTENFIKLIHLAFRSPHRSRY